jgi:hypothetical protein
MKKPNRKLARKALFEAIENQMQDGNPPATRETFDRLRAAGFSRKETMKYLACVLLVELNEMIRDNRLYDEANYVNRLEMLPLLPWDYEPEDDD